MKIDGRFWLTKEDKSFLGSGRVELLKKIQKTGSISAAAKEMKMSYKAAWERINGMNELADQPLITRTTGGKGGGGTTLTPYAYEIIGTFDKLSALHRQFIQRFSQAGDDPEHLAKILNRTFLTTSARNQLPATIKEIHFDDLDADLNLSLAQDVTLISTITTKSIANMYIKPTSKVYAIIKSSDITIVNQRPTLTQDLNIIQGIIHSVEVSKHSLEVSLEVNEHIVLTSLMHNEQDSNFEIGSKAFALIKKNNIIIGL